MAVRPGGLQGQRRAQPEAAPEALGQVSDAERNVVVPLSEGSAEGEAQVSAERPPELFGAQLTPMMRQYLETKALHPDAILFFRLGDFYEMFFEDAVRASELLQITLTARSKGDERVPMC